MRRWLRILVPGVAFVGLAACASLDGARHYRSGSEALERGEVAQAIVELEQAAVLLPEASEVRNHLGIAYLEAGRSDDALREFEDARTMRPCTTCARCRTGRRTDEWRRRSPAPELERDRQAARSPPIAQ
jgi:tetratricopeptide (TPR) repeat protein